MGPASISNTVKSTLTPVTAQKGKEEGRREFEKQQVEQKQRERGKRKDGGTEAGRSSIKFQHLADTTVVGQQKDEERAYERRDENSLSTPASSARGTGEAPLYCGSNEGWMLRVPCLRPFLF